MNIKAASADEQVDIAAYQKVSDKMVIDLSRYWHLKRQF